jgi:hypothetical protein
MQVNFFNGAKTPDAWDPKSPAYIDDWKPESQVVDCAGVQVTYGAHLKLFMHDGEVKDFFWSEKGLIELDGVFYGDFSIVVEDADGNT